MSFYYIIRNDIECQTMSEREKKQRIPYGYQTVEIFVIVTENGIKMACLAIQIGTSTKKKESPT